MSLLPIEAVLPALAGALRTHGAVVLQAPPGAGKTTRVPLYLLETGPGYRRIVMLEPRRVAARAAAERMASALGEPLGARVGYRIRGEAVAGSGIEVVTEGILTRMLQSDPELPGVGCVIFDEFHERGMQADLGLALTLEARAALRPDLALVVMSATLDAEPVAALLNAPVVTAAGRIWPVETRWLEQPQKPASGGGPRLEHAVAAQVEEALAETEGGLLVFLPGRAEIARTAAQLAKTLPPDVVLQPLHGGLALERQRAALAPLRGKRKLVLATAIAETSLTIPDVRVVIDAGLARRSRFDPASGMSRLVTERATRAEADQRRGRAGRTAPGWCYRMWTRGEEGAFRSHPPAEIAAADLAGLALELALWGVVDPGGLGFLTPPPEAALTKARALLRAVGALDASDRITAHGRRLAGLPLHPRLGHMLVRGSEAGSRDRAAALCALLAARDPLRGSGQRAPADLALRLDALGNASQVERQHPVAVDRAAAGAIRDEATRLRRLAGSTRSSAPLSATPLALGGLLSLAYPDRIAQRRAGGEPRYRLSGGKGARLDSEDALSLEPWLVAADLDGDPREALIRQAAVISEDDIRALHGERTQIVNFCAWSRRDRTVIVRERLMLDALVLEERRWSDAPANAVAAALCEGVRDLGIQALPWTPAARRLADRVNWLCGRGIALPDLSETGLLEGLEDWLAPHLAGMSRAEDLARVDVRQALESMLGWEAREQLERLAPAAITAPTGTRLVIDYGGAQPRVSVRLQEMFGLCTHPTLGPARLPLVIELLSPAQRPVQTTVDLPGFWAKSYADVRRELRGRYPRHAWPEDPTVAEPTRRAKPRGA